MTLKDFEVKLPARQFIDLSFSTFISVRSTDKGISDLRLRKDDFYKKLVEEILPIASFLGTFERVGLNIECEYFSGDQSYDAKIYCGGLLVEKDIMLKEYFLEVSIACHENDHLVRQAIEQGIPAFRGDSIRKENGVIKSIPVVHSPDSIIISHSNFINIRIDKKSKKDYPSNTFLIVPLFPTTIILWDEWLQIIGEITN